MSPHRCVLVLDDGSATPKELLARLRHLGIESLCAGAPADAARHLESDGDRIGILFVTPGAVADDLPHLVQLLRERSAPRRARAVVVGPAPGHAGREALRAAGVERALWEPYDDGTLRFVVNEELAPPEDDAERHELRVPTTLLARVEVGGRHKDALVYNLSASGVYLETPRPSVRGAQVVLAIPLPEGEVRAQAQVAFTNVPGNLQRPSLPFGMGVRFLRLDPVDEERLRRYIEERARRLVV